MNKVALDVACGGKMFWFDKKNENTLFVDIRREKHILSDGRKFEVQPDEIMDFRDLKLPDNSFKLVVFDPPHLIKLGKSSWMAKKYGVLSDTWQEDIKKGFNECFRVLEEYGTLIFKWNERDVKVRDLLELSPYSPMFGHTTGNSGATKWICFMKINNLKKGQDERRKKFNTTKDD